MSTGTQTTTAAPAEVKRPYTGTSTPVGPTERFEFQQSFYAITPVVHDDYGIRSYQVRCLSGSDFSWYVQMAINSFDDPDPRSRRQIYTLAGHLATLFWRDVTPEDRLMYRRDAADLLEFAVEVTVRMKPETDA